MDTTGDRMQYVAKTLIETTCF